jgi:hypothetical protein
MLVLTARKSGSFLQENKETASKGLSFDYSTKMSRNQRAGESEREKKKRREDRDRQN